MGWGEEKIFLDTSLSLFIIHPPSVDKNVLNTDPPPDFLN